MNKDVIIVICLLIAAGAIVFGIHSSEKQNKLAKGLEEERYSRMVAEETSQKSAAKAATLETKLKQADAKMESFKEILDQEKGVTADLKKQYEKAVRAKSDLEAKLKAVLEERATAPQTTMPEVPAMSGAGAQ